MLIISNLEKEEILQKCNNFNLENVVLWNLNSSKLFTYKPHSKPTKIVELNYYEVFQRNYFEDFNNLTLKVSLPTVLETKDDECENVNCGFLKVFGKKYKLKYNFKSHREFKNPDINIGYIQQKGFSYIYPVERFASTAIIPIVPEDDFSKMYFLPFQRGLWIIIILFVIYFGTVLSFVSYIIHRNINFTLNLLKGFAFILQSGVKIKTDRKMVLIIYILMLFFGICVTMLYSLFLGSFFIVPMEKTNYTILYNKETEPIIRVANRDIFEGPYRVLRAEDHIIHSFYIELNTSFGYIINSRQWEIDFYFQRNLRKHVFRVLIPWRTTSAVIGPMLQENSFVRKKMDRLFLTTYSAGLNQHWIHLTSMKNLSRKVNAILNDRKEAVEIRDIIDIMKFYFCGLGFAGLAFFGEFIKKYFK